MKKSHTVPQLKKDTAEIVAVSNAGLLRDLHVDRFIGLVRIEMVNCTIQPHLLAISPHLAKRFATSIETIEEKTGLSIRQSNGLTEGVFQLWVDLSVPRLTIHKTVHLSSLSLNALILEVTFALTKTGFETHHVVMNAHELETITGNNRITLEQLEKLLMIQVVDDTRWDPNVFTLVAKSGK